jgi:citrate lyase subunit beta/citryl-CoA lyase
VTGAVLFVGAGDGEGARTAAASDADEVILDLEDLVPPDRRLAAREAVAETLAARPDRQLWHLRVNPLGSPLAFDDMMLALSLPLAGIVVPKVEGPEDLAIAHWVLSAAERARGPAPGSLGIIAIMETARAFVALDRLGGPWAGRVRLGLGTGDLVTELSLVRTDAEDEIAYFRSALVNASRAHGFRPPIDSVWIALDDDDGLRRSALRGRAFGLAGKFCLNDRQAGVLKAAFAPTEAEAARARRIVAAFDAAARGGRGSVIVEGEFVDAPIAARYRAMLEGGKAADRRH